MLEIIATIYTFNDLSIKDVFTTDAYKDELLMKTTEVTGYNAVSLSTGERRMVRSTDAVQPRKATLTYS